MTEISLTAMEDRLHKLPQLIYNANKIVISTRSSWLRSKIDLAKKKAEIMLLAKANAVGSKAPTQTDLNARADDETYQLELGTVTAEANYREAVGKKKQLDNEFVAIRKIAALRSVTY